MATGGGTGDADSKLNDPATPGSFQLVLSMEHYVICFTDI